MTSINLERIAMDKVCPRLSVLLVVFLMLCACGKPDTPDQVANDFWTAIQANDAQKVKKYVSAKDKNTLQNVDDVLAIGNVSFGKIVIDAEQASVDTTVTLAGDQQTTLPINTHLILENKHWVVDYDRTMQTMLAAGQVAAVINQFKDIGNAIKDGISQSVTEFQTVIPEIEKNLGDLEQQIEQAVPKLKSRFQKFSEELEQALNSPSTAPPIGENEATPDAPADKPNAESEIPRLSDELAQIEQEILSSVPELKQQIEGFVEKLQDALKIPPQQNSSPDGETESIEI
ncbi:MAG: hypothetical protein AAF387_07015 [Pseudomonadota bacterium]